MSTKDDKYSFIEKSFTTSENQCYNLNLNQSEKCATLIPVQSYSKLNNDKYFAATDFTVSDNYEEKEKLQSWNKSSQASPFTTLNEDNNDFKKRWKNENTLNITNKSTLTLYIPAHENSIEASGSDLFVNENINGLNKAKFGSIKISKRCFFNNLKFRDPFEFLKQQNGDQQNKPEVMQQFGSSQSSSTSQKTENIERNNAMMFIVLKLDSEHGKPPAAHLQKKAEFKVIRDRQHQRRDELATLFGVDLCYAKTYESKYRCHIREQKISIHDNIFSKYCERICATTKDNNSDPMFETELCQTAASPSASDMNQKENNNNLLTLDSVLD